MLSVQCHIQYTCEKDTQYLFSVFPDFDILHKIMIWDTVAFRHTYNEFLRSYIQNN